jgi:hypothetical protein
VAPPHPPAVPHAGTEARPRSLGLLPYTIVGAALLTAAPFSLQWSQKAVTLSLDSADARIGRPLTPFSVAGVHRRAYRRAVYGAAAYGVGSYYGASGYGSYGYPAYGYGSYASGYGYGHRSLYASAAGYPGYGSYASGYSGYGYRSLYATAAGYPGYGYGGWAARRVAIHRARWH